LRAWGSLQRTGNGEAGSASSRLFLTLNPDNNILVGHNTLNCSILAKIESSAERCTPCFPYYFAKMIAKKESSQVPLWDGSREVLQAATVKVELKFRETRRGSKQLHVLFVCPCSGGCRQKPLNCPITVAVFCSGFLMGFSHLKIAF